MIQTALYNRTDDSTIFGQQDASSPWPQLTNTQWLWVDLYDVPAEEEAELLETQFKIHPLAIADAQRDRHPPKFESFGQRIFLLLRDLPKEIQELDENIQPVQVALFLDHNLLITRRSIDCEPLEVLWEEARADALDFAKGPPHIAYLLTRYITDRYTRTLLALETELEDFEEKLLTQSSDHLLSELVWENRKLKKMRRALTYQYNAIAAFQQHSADYIEEDIRHEFNDVREQFERLSSLALLQEELVADMINGYISLSSHRLNQIMKVLTIVTVIFMPLGIIAGIYGMNFDNMPELHWKYGYMIALGLMGTVVLSLLYILRRLRWI
jgi:magnesium transporter